MKNKILYIFLFISILKSQELTSMNINFLETEFKKAIRFERIGQFESAESIYLDLLKNDPKNSRIYFQLKSLYKREKNYLGLNNLLEKRMKVFPNDLQTKIEIGEVYLFLNEEGKAKQYWNNILLKFQSNKTVYIILFQMYLKHNFENEISSLVEKGRIKFDDPSFLSYELGNFNSKKLDFYNSIKEYLIYLNSNPKQFKIVSSRILIMSNDSSNFNLIQKSFMDYIEKNYLSDKKIIRNVYIDFLFKSKKYKEAFKQLNLLPKKSEDDYLYWIKFGNNLRIENETEISINVFSKILNSLNKEITLENSQISKLTGMSLYGLALSYEKKIKPFGQTKSIGEFFPNNIFFLNKIIDNKSSSINLIEETFNMYDSILTNVSNNDFPAQAHFRIAELKYLINKNFDGAINSYKSASKNKLFKEIYFKSNLRISDVFFTQGNINKSKSHLNEMYEDSNFNLREKELIKIKLIKIHFLNGELEETNKYIDELLFSINFENSYYNDLIELKGFIKKHFNENNQKGKDAFLNYLIGEKLLVQNQIIASSSFFRNIIKSYDNSSIIPETIFRLAQINNHLKNHEKALTHLESLKDTNLGALGAVYAGEMLDKKLDLKKDAEKWYFNLLENYPESLYVEPVRFRLRQIREK